MTRPTRPSSAELAVLQAEQDSDIDSGEARTIAHVINLQIAGWTLDEIATHMELPREMLVSALIAHQKRFVKNQADLREYMRGLAGDRLDALLKAVWADATNPESPRQFPAQDRALKNIESQRKLWGLDAPNQVEISHKPTDEAVADLVQQVHHALTGIPMEDEDILDIAEADVLPDEVDPGPGQAESVQHEPMDITAASQTMAMGRALSDQALSDPEPEPDPEACDA